MEFKIREAREAANLSQRELAKLLGIAPATLHGYETGKHDPKSDLLVQITKKILPPRKLRDRRTL